MAKYLYIAFPMVAALLAISVVQADSPTEVEGATTVDSATAKDLLDRGVPFIDVRSTNNYEAGHVPGATHLSTALTESELAEVASKNQEVVIYCDGPTCTRSSSVCKTGCILGLEESLLLPSWVSGVENCGLLVRIDSWSTYS